MTPDVRRYPREAAEASGSFLMLMLGPRGGLPRSERQPESLNRGELRWSEREKGRKMLVSPAAFKSADSSLFRGNPSRMMLPNLDGLYERIDAYHRGGSRGRRNPAGLWAPASFAWPARRQQIERLRGHHLLCG